MKNGEVASFQDNAAHGEDAFVIRELGETSCMDAVLDGLTYCEGSYASNFTAQHLQSSELPALDDLVGVLRQANETLFQGGRGRSLLTTVSVALKVGTDLHVINVGDSPGYLVRGGQATELTSKSQSVMLPSMITIVLGLREELAYEYKKVELQPGDRLLLITDGISNNLTPEEMAVVVQSASSAQAAADALGELLAERRRLRQGTTEPFSTFREDDRTAVIRFLA